MIKKSDGGSNEVKIRTNCVTSHDCVADDAEDVIDQNEQIIYGADAHRHTGLYELGRERADRRGEHDDIALMHSARHNIQDHLICAAEVEILQAAYERPGARHAAV
jgi:hypothetical protein